MDTERFPPHPQDPGYRPLDGVQERTYNHPADRFWALYLADADRNDTAMTDNIKGDTDGMLIFTGLFAATVAAFIVEFYKKLNPDSGDDTVTLLSGISHQVASLSNGTQASSASSSSFHAPISAVRINSLWFISLFLSLSVALASTLVQQWCRRYLRAARRRRPPHKRGPVHVVLSEGMKRFHVEHVVEVIIGLLHLSVFLFLAGLVDFLLVVSPSVAQTILPFMAVGGAAYSLLTMLPFFFPSSPYDTPLTHLVRILLASFYTSLWALLLLARYVEELVVPWFSRGFPSQDTLSFLTHSTSRLKQLTSRLYRTRKRILEDTASFPYGERAQYAFHTTLKVLDEELEVEEFLVGLPGLLDSDLAKEYASNMTLYLIQKQALMHRMNRLLKTCSLGLSSLPSAMRLRRVQAVLGALRNVLIHVVRSPMALRSLGHTDGELNTIFTLSSIMNKVWWLCRDDGPDPSIALYAACTLAQLRNTLMYVVRDNTGATDREIDSSPASRSCIVQILNNITWDPLRSGGHHFEHTDPNLRWTPTNKEISPLTAGDGTQCVKRAIRRGGYLDNLNCYVRKIWFVHHLPDAVSPRDHDLIVGTMRTLSRAFLIAYDRKQGILWKDAIDDFAGLWNEITQHRGSRVRSRSGDEGGRPDNALPARFLEYLQEIADVVLPLAQPQKPSPPNPACSTASLALLTPIPDPTSSKFEYLEDATSEEVCRDGAHSPNGDVDTHGSETEHLERAVDIGAQQSKTGVLSALPSPDQHAMEADGCSASSAFGRALKASSQGSDGRVQALDADEHVERDSQLHNNSQDSCEITLHDDSSQTKTSKSVADIDGQPQLAEEEGPDRTDDKHRGSESEGEGFEVVVVPREGR